MRFISTHREQRVVLRPKRRKIVETADQGTITEVIDGISVQFEPFAVPFHTNLLPTKNNTGAAFGWADSEKAAYQNNVPESVIIDGLMNHKAYGISFVGISDNGELADLDSRFIESNPDGSFFCKLCNKHSATAQGLNGHKRSNQHIALMEAEEAKARKASGIPNPSEDN